MRDTSGSIKGFTILELSIVIVIIGLIIAGISAGTSLIRQANLRSVISTVNQYKIAVKSFESQYNALPGDMLNATSYWGSATNNGNGNKRIASFPGGGTKLEHALFWQHLYLAGLVNINLTDMGRGLGTGHGTATGYNIPESSIKYAGFTAIYPNAPEDLSFTNWNYWKFANLGRHFFALTGSIQITDTTSASRIDVSPVMNVYDTMSIDQKIDDGLPNTGNVGNLVPSNISLYPSSCRIGALTVVGQAASNTYNTSDTDVKACAMIFAM